MVIGFTLSGENVLATFAPKDIVDFSYERQCTSDYSQPIYDVYPCYGRLTVKDQDLKIYNMAINGQLDDLDYFIYFSVGDKVAEKFYVTKLPEYSYADKTVTFTLGDEFTRADTLLYGGYPYPSQPKTLYDIFLSVLESYYVDLSHMDIGIMTFTKWYDYSKYFKGYFESIEIPYPYIPSGKTYREVFRWILTVARCALVSKFTSLSTHPSLVNMSGRIKIKYDGEFTPYEGLSSTSAMALPTKTITSQFLPNVFLSNKFNTCDNKSKQVSIKYYKDSIITTHELGDVNIPAKYEAHSDYDDKGKWAAVDAATKHCAEVYFYWEHEKTTSNSSGSTRTFEDTIPVLYNGNLGKILALTAVSGSNPRYQLTFEKTVKYVSGNVEFEKKGTDFHLKKDTFVSDEENPEMGETTEILTMEELPKLESFSYTASELYGMQETITATLTSKVNEQKYNITTSGTDYINEMELRLGREFTAICAEFSEDVGAGGTVESANLAKAYKYTITYKFKSLSITYNGNYTEIVYNDDTVTATTKGTNDKEKKVTIADGGMLMQYVSGSANYPKLVCDYTLSAFANGLHGGEIEVIGWDYYGWNNTKKVINYNNKASTKKFFEVGDYVIPLKNDGSPIMTKPDTDNSDSGIKPMLFQVVKVAITAQGSSFIQRLTLREVIDYFS